MISVSCDLRGADPDGGDTVGEQVDHKLAPARDGLGNEPEIASEILDGARGRGVQDARKPDRIRRVVGDFEEGLGLVAQGPHGDSVVFLISAGHEPAGPARPAGARRTEANLRTRSS